MIKYLKGSDIPPYQPNSVVERFWPLGRPELFSGIPHGYPDWLQNWPIVYESEFGDIWQLDKNSFIIKPEINHSIIFPTLEQALAFLPKE